MNRPARVEEHPVRPTDHEVGVAVEVEVGGADTEASDPGSEPSSSPSPEATGDVREREVAVVAQQDARATGEPVLGDEQVDLAVTVVVEQADGAGALGSVQRRHGGETSVVVAQHGRGLAAIAVPDVAGHHQVEVAVAVEVSESRPAGASALPGKVGSTVKPSAPPSSSRSGAGPSAPRYR